MGPFYLSLYAILFSITTNFIGSAVEVPFYQNYIPDWGKDHVSVVDQGRQVEIRIDRQSGGGFSSRNAYGSGYFQLSLKVPQNARGIVTTFYLISVPDSAAGVVFGGNHDELDFEFLGHDGPPYILSTNVFAQDSGHREQQFELWFDPTADFHDYEILWNDHQIVFFIDKMPIRVFANNRKIGASYPKLPMYLHASVWNSSGWLGPVDWSRGPFLAKYRGFEIYGCPHDNSNPTKCDSSNYNWNAPTNWQLNPQQWKLYENIKKNYMTFDYCQSSSRKDFPECGVSV